MSVLLTDTSAQCMMKSRKTSHNLIGYLCSSTITAYWWQCIHTRRHRCSYQEDQAKVSTLSARPDHKHGVSAVPLTAASLVRLVQYVLGTVQSTQSLETGGDLSHSQGSSKQSSTFTIKFPTHCWTLGIYTQTNWKYTKHLNILLLLRTLGYAV